MVKILSKLINPIGFTPPKTIEPLIMMFFFIRNIFLRICKLVMQLLVQRQGMKILQMLRVALLITLRLPARSLSIPNLSAVLPRPARRRGGRADVRVRGWGPVLQQSMNL